MAFDLVYVKKNYTILNAWKFHTNKYNNIWLFSFWDVFGIWDGDFGIAACAVGISYSMHSIWNFVFKCETFDTRLRNFTSSLVVAVAKKISYI